VEVSLEDQESLPYRLYIEELERQKGVTLALQEQVSYKQILYKCNTNSVLRILIHKCPVGSQLGNKLCRVGCFVGVLLGGLRRKCGVPADENLFEHFGLKNLDPDPDTNVRLIFFKHK
jgi:hypothetical protein